MISSWRLLNHGRDRPPLLEESKALHSKKLLFCHYFKEVTRGAQNLTSSFSWQRARQTRAPHNCVTRAGATLYLILVCNILAWIIPSKVLRTTNIGWFQPWKSFYLHPGFSVSLNRSQLKETGTSHKISTKPSHKRICKMKSSDNEHRCPIQLHNRIHHDFV